MKPHLVIKYSWVLAMIAAMNLSPSEIFAQPAAAKAPKAKAPPQSAPPDAVREVQSPREVIGLNNNCPCMTP